MDAVIEVPSGAQLGPVGGRLWLAVLGRQTATWARFRCTTLQGTRCHALPVVRHEVGADDVVVPGPGALMVGVVGEVGPVPDDHILPVD
jgi:hypothetical protein